VTGRMLIAGVGNIFLCDDGFGVEVASRLATADLPDWVRVADYGISGMHLAYDLAEGYESTILVDATARGGEPGTVYVMELDTGVPSAAAAPAAPAAAAPAPAAPPAPAPAAPAPAGPTPASAVVPRAPGAPVAGSGVPLLDAHGMQPDVVLGMLNLLGAEPGRVFLVGCEPASTDEGIGLSEPVTAAVDEAVRIVLDLVRTADTITQIARKE
jgi:hydrogenase maturation protease